MLKCRKIKKLISGGIFANGSYVVCDKVDYKEIVNINNEGYINLYECFWWR